MGRRRRGRWSRSTGVTEGYCFRDMWDKENVIFWPEFTDCANGTLMHICLRNNEEKSKKRSDYCGNQKSETRNRKSSFCPEVSKAHTHSPTDWLPLEVEASSSTFEAAIEFTPLSLPSPYIDFSPLAPFNCCAYPSPLFNIQIPGPLATLSPQALSFPTPLAFGFKEEIPNASTHIERTLTGLHLPNASRRPLIHCRTLRTNPFRHNQSSFVQTCMGACPLRTLDCGKLTSGKEQRPLHMSTEPLRNDILIVAASS